MKTVKNYEDDDDNVKHDDTTGSLNRLPEKFLTHRFSPSKNISS